MILVTGGLGYIGANLCKHLLTLGEKVIIVDNFSSNVVERDFFDKIPVYEGDIRDTEFLKSVFRLCPYIDKVIHCAGVKSVQESEIDPIKYYDINVKGTISLISAMQSYNIRTIIYSSSATVYGDCKDVPFTEKSKGKVSNPYGLSKYTCEQLLTSLNDWNVVILRYFNPLGGEIRDIQKIPTNIYPILNQVANKEREYLAIYGGDYNTPDGTCIRDYIHVDDVASAHSVVLNSKGIHIYNVGRGEGVSVLELVQAYTKKTGKAVPYKITERRKGDVPMCYADVSKLQNTWGWQALYSIEDMCV